MTIAGDESRATCGRRRRHLSRALVATQDVVADLSALRTADVSLVVDLAVLAQRLRARGRHLEVVAVPPHVLRLIRQVGLDRMPAVAVAVA